MPRYDAAEYDPPAPIALVTLRHITTEAIAPGIRMLLDTGADVTLLPWDAVTRLGVEPLPGTERELVGFDGTRSLSAAVELDMIFLGRAFRGRYLLTDAGEGILGRDVLAAVVILLMGRVGSGRTTAAK
jgi:hypothetical protein